MQEGIAGGTVGRIIGEQRNDSGSSPAAGALAQHDIGDARDLLVLQRGQRAIQLRSPRHSAGDDDYAEELDATGIR